LAKRALSSAMKAGSIALPAAMVLDAAQPEFLHQTVLKRLVGTLDPPLGLALPLSTIEHHL
jgi:hypothetical protein